MRRTQNTTSHDTLHADIVALLTGDELTSLFNGAYFLLQDNGLYYLKWRGLAHQLRYSSHIHETEQWSVYGNILSECLFSTRRINGELCTWFQLERYSHAYTHLIPHGLCFLMYKWTGENVGPQGTSPHTEHNPIVIRKERVDYGAHLKLEMQ